MEYTLITVIIVAFAAHPTNAGPCCRPDQWSAKKVVETVGKMYTCWTLFSLIVLGLIKNYVNHLWGFSDHNSCSCLDCVDYKLNEYVIVVELSTVEVENTKHCRVYVSSIW